MRIAGLPGLALRLVIFLVTATVGGGPSIFDGCLVNCHAEAHGGARGESAHCHAAAESNPGAPSITSTATCDHDHGAAWADVREVSTASAAKAVGDLPASHPSLSAPAFSRPDRTDLAADASLVVAALLVPLRI